MVKILGGGESGGSRECYFSQWGFFSLPVKVYGESDESGPSTVSQKRKDRNDN